MRTFIVLACVITIVGCTADQSCATRPTDPLCQAPDSGVDSGPGDTGADAHMPCGGSCTGTMPHCLTTSTETCVECIVETDCTASANGPHCDMTGAHACVECLANTDCTDPGMSRCDTASHTCNACGAAADCSHITGAHVCDSSSTCVECDATDQTACTSGICLTSTNTCATAGGSTGTCGMCAADTDCQAGQLCVAMTSHGTAVGSYCAWRQDAAGSGAPNGNCASVAPYGNGAAATSIDGVATMVCELVVSSCPALNDFRTGGASATGHCTGPTTGVTDDPDCGAAGVADGFCRIDSSTNHFCTVECTTMSDCPCTALACTTHYPCSGGLCSLNP